MFVSPNRVRIFRAIQFFTPNIKFFQAPFSSIDGIKLFVESLDAADKKTFDELNAKLMSVLESQDDQKKYTNCIMQFDEDQGKSLIEFFNKNENLLSFFVDNMRANSEFCDKYNNFVRTLQKAKP